MRNILLILSAFMLFACKDKDDSIPSSNYELRENFNNSFTLVKWKNEATTSIDMQADAKLQKVEFIENEAFRLNKALTSITFPSKLYRIGSEAFYGTDLSGGVKFNTLSDSEVYFGELAFARTNITEIDLPNTRWIGSKMFEFCTSLKDVKFKRGVWEIGNYAFAYCTSLEYVSLERSYLLKVGQGAFANCEKLRNVYLPQAVTEIGDVAFAYCNSLESITIDAKTPPTLGEDVFFGVKNIPRIYVFSRDAYKNAPGWSAFADKIYSK